MHDFLKLSENIFWQLYVSNTTPTKNVTTTKHLSMLLLVIMHSASVSVQINQDNN